MNERFHRWGPHGNQKPRLRAISGATEIMAKITKTVVIEPLHPYESTNPRVSDPAESDSLGAPSSNFSTVRDTGSLVLYRTASGWLIGGCE